MTLDQLMPGETAVIRACAPGTPLGLRLLALGLTPGASIRCVMRAPLGEPSAYRIRRTLLALGSEAAQLVVLRRACYTMQSFSGGDSLDVRPHALRSCLRLGAAPTGGGDARSANHPL